MAVFLWGEEMGWGRLFCADGEFVDGSKNNKWIFPEWKTLWSDAVSFHIGAIFIIAINVQCTKMLPEFQAQDAHLARTAIQWDY